MSDAARRKQERRRGSADDDRRSGCWPASPSPNDGCELAGISTAVLEGGDGPPVVLLHGPGEFAAMWMRVIPGLVRTHRVVAPDLPGHGASGAGDGPLDADRVLAWLDELIERDLPLAAGAGRARARRRHRRPLRHRPQRPAWPAGAGGRVRAGSVRAGTQLRAGAGGASWRDRTERTPDGLFGQCFADLRRLAPARWASGGSRWRPTRSTEPARPTCRPRSAASCAQFALPAIPAAELARIAVPTTLIWGRQDLAVPLRVAEAAERPPRLAAARDRARRRRPAMEQPEAFLETLRHALGASARKRAAS